MPVYRARAISYYIMAFQGIFPLGSLLVGAMASAWGIHYTLLLQGVAGVLVVMAFMGYIWRHINRKYVPI